MKYIATIFALMLIFSAGAEPHFYPLTSIAEDFGATWCGGCLLAIEGLSVVHGNTHNGEFVSARLYTESGNLSSPSVDARFSYYDVLGIPAVIFNGKTRVDGSGDGIADGSVYTAALKPYLYSASPLKMNITDFSAVNGRITGNVEMLSTTLSIVNQQLHLYLVEDNVSEGITNVTRQVVSLPLNLFGAGNTVTFDQYFTINPAWNANNLWALAFVQIEDAAILQTAHTLPLPQYNFRAAFDWDANIVGNAGLFESPALWFFNLGQSDNYIMQIVIDSAPEDWYFNYCGEDGNCYPGNLPMPLNLLSGGKVAFHLNLWIGSSGIGNFRFVLSSPNLGTYSIPFRFRTSDVSANDDHYISQPTLLKGNYPNPFNPSTTIDYQIPAKGNVRLEIYNMKGQKVQTLVNELKTSGSHSVVWNGIDQSGHSVVSGVYFYRLVTENNTITKRMLLLK
ncbi:MAG: T9SS type A sorting domain-containing protein [Candidatus Cloacimonadaceae bacterium]|nr:T9SS type A sorting domain-containing protein [Candidatus Cloacimonadaceae bacterium]MDP3113326.1 T9SS type A sorting domain-containing protein [Candidatus Cloacimonadaceae bacterium]